MTTQSKTVLKSYFETGDKPTQSQFGDLIDSFADVSAPSVTTNFTVSDAAGNTCFVVRANPAAGASTGVLLFPGLDTGQNPEFGIATTTRADCGISWRFKGSPPVPYAFHGTSAAAARIALYQAVSSPGGDGRSASIRAPDAIDSSYSLILPTSAPNENRQIWVGNINGELKFYSQASLGIMSTSASRSIKFSSGLGIVDENSNTQILFTTTSGATNGLKVVNASAAARATLNTTAGDLALTSNNGNVVVGTVALAKTATAGFPWIPSCPGNPTGAPVAPYTNAAAMVVDTSSSRLYVLVGSTWKSTALT